MEFLLIHWVQSHVETLRYGAVVIGFIYSYWRKFTSAQLEDKDRIIKNDYILKLARDLIETNQLKDDVEKRAALQLDEKNLLFEDNTKLQKTVTEFNTVITDLKTRLSEIENVCEVSPQAQVAKPDKET
jgi:hypothetical protein